MVAKEISEPWARTICEWTGKLPEGSRDAADGILLAAAISGLGLPDLAWLAGEMYERSRQHQPDRDGPGPGPDPDHDPSQDRSRGRNQSQGGNQEQGQGPEQVGNRGWDPGEGRQPGADADPGEARDRDEGAVFDDRSVRLAITFGGAGVIRGDLTPECAQVVRAVLDALSARAGAEDDRSHEQRYHDALQEVMFRLVAAGLVPQRAGQPVKVLAHVTLADLMLLRGATGCGRNGPARRGPGGPATRPATPKPAGTAISREALEQAIIGKAVDLLSGPGGLASFVRQRQLGLRLAGPSLPLDIGVSTTIPAGIRNAVRLRDLHCQWAGGCSQPASSCDVHHTRHKANGGKTSLKDCVLLCRFHHQIVIHRWGWTLVVNPDGTTTAWNKDKTKVLHSHGPPVRAGPARAG